MRSGDDVLLVLEAMKTEIPVMAGEANIGRTVVGFGKGVAENAPVRPGDILIILS